MSNADRVRSLTGMLMRRRVRVGIDLISLFCVSLILFCSRGLHRLSLIPDGASSTRLLLAAIAVWIFLFALNGSYRASYFGAGDAEYNRVVKASGQGLIVLAALGYVLDGNVTAMVLVLVSLCFCITALMIRWMVRHLVRRSWERGSNLRPAVVVGAPATIPSVLSVLGRHRENGYRVVGYLSQTSLDDVGVPWLGAVNDLVGAFARERPNFEVVVFAGGGFPSLSSRREMMWWCGEHGLLVLVAPGLIDVDHNRLEMHSLGAFPMLQVDMDRPAKSFAPWKRAFDLTGACLLILLLSPVLFVAGLAIWRFDRGPVFYRSSRVGLRGTVFECLKFRTMRVHDLGESLPVARDKSADDPRITPPGRWLRRFSIDELPQLFNVVRGEMSLVGPRPQTRHELESYVAHHEHILKVRPGMSGLWQVSGRSNLTREERERLDLFYVDNWSFFTDVRILMRTVKAVLSREGAY